MTPRRRFLVLACGLAAARAQATPEAAREAMRTVDPADAARTGRVRLEISPLVDNGNAVALAVSVESPMTAADHVASIHVFADGNPQPHVFAVHLGPRAGRAAVATRIRLADSQRVTAIARMSDGSLWRDSADVVVTLGACLEDESAAGGGAR